MLQSYSMQRIEFEELKSTIKKAFIHAGMSEDQAEICARTHAETSCDGIFSHGLNRVERFINYIENGWVNLDAKPTFEQKFGSIEIYNGNLAPGVTNAFFAMDRAIEIAKSTGLGLVSLNNTTHWMRGGTYGWHAANQGVIGICWTNTESCMPAWGATSVSIGNNPFVIAIPRREGHVVLDMAMSQYSYGKLENTRLNNEKLPYAGGFDSEGLLTDDPGEIEKTRRILPTGYWKGSSFAIMLDLLASLLSNGKTTAAIDPYGYGNCGGCSQVFIAIDPLKMNDQPFVDQVLKQTIDQLKQASPVAEGGEILYPGERSFKNRRENLIKGVPVHDSVWENVKKLAGL